MTTSRVGVKHRLWEAAGPVRRLAVPLLGTVVAVDTTEPVVAFTFDDGPDPTTTPQVLDALDRHGVHATFFVLVDQAERAPEVLRETRSRGHEIGLHGLVHRRLQTASTRQAAAVIHEGRRRLEALLGEPISLFRPPGGAQTVRSMAIARGSGLRTVLWSATARDWVRRPIPAMVTQAMDELSTGGILLLHDGKGDPGRPDPGIDRAELVDRLLTEVEARNWQPVTAGELLSGRRPKREVRLKARRRAAA